MNNEENSECDICESRVIKNRTNFIDSYHDSLSTRSAEASKISLAKLSIDLYVSFLLTNLIFEDTGLIGHLEKYG